MQFSIRVAVTFVVIACAASAHAQSSTVPPVPVESPAAIYPDALITERASGVVELLVTVLADGSVGEVTVAVPAHPEMVAAAVAAVMRWRFQPATRDGQAVASRIRVPFRFEPPVVEVVDGPAPSASTSAAASVGASPSTTAASSPNAPVTVAPPTGSDASRSAASVPPPAASSASPSAPSAEEDDVIDVNVRGKRRPPPRAASDFVLGQEVFAAVPKQSASELLASAPGVYVSRPEGDAVAQEIYLRGFDASHGQDIELSVGAVPLNQPSHLHGQGYADTNFVIPEVVRSLRVTEGVYDPRQGDFAVAGSINFDLGVERRGILSRTSLGSYGTKRQVLLWAPEGEAEETFGAVSIRESDGFGMNRGSRSGGGIAQYMLRLGARTTALFHVAAYGARANLAGILRRDDVAAGRVGFYDSYPDPSANAQSALASRAQAAMTLEHETKDGGRTTLSLWLMQANYRSRQNFTGYLQRSRTNPDWVGRGDLIEQSNDDFGLGAKASYRTRQLHPFDDLVGNVELGLAVRTDGIGQKQSLLQAPQNQIWDEQVDASVRGSDIGVYADIDFRYRRWLALRGGYRADVLYYDIDDRLGNFIPAYLNQTYLVGYRRTALGIAGGPRATLDVTPIEGLSLLASYGEGYRSPQARILEEGENAPYAKVHAAEVGATWKPTAADWLTLTGTLYRTTLSQDLAFDASDARLERIGPTTRKGFAATALAQPRPWATVSLSVTYVRATLDEPPPASAENPTPAFTSGELLPYVPPLVVRGDASMSRPLTTIADAELVGRIGSGFTFLSKRPLPYGQFGQTVPLWDASASLRYRIAELGIEVYNLLDKQYAASEYSFVSNWNSTELPSRTAARHFSAGAPRSLFGTLTLVF